MNRKTNRNVSWALRRLKYLLLNPKYFYLYLYGKPEKVIAAAAGTPESDYFSHKEELDRDPSFLRDLRENTARHLKTDFRFNVDHYFLYSLIRTIKPSVYLETGVFHGYYTACVLKGMHDNFRNGSSKGKVISIDLPAYEGITESTSETDSVRLPSGCEPGWVIPDGLRDLWELHTGDSRKLLPEIADRESDISIFFHDSLHTYSHMMFEFETVYPLLRQGAYVMSHDIHWNRAFRHFAKKHDQNEYGVHGFGIFRKNG